MRYWLHAETKTFSNLAVPFLGFTICGFIWLNLSHTALVLGTIWMSVGIVYGAIKTRGFRGQLVNFDLPYDDEIY